VLTEFSSDHALDDVIALTASQISYVQGSLSLKGMRTSIRMPQAPAPILLQDNRLAAMHGEEAAGSYCPKQTAVSSSWHLTVAAFTVSTL